MKTSVAYWIVRRVVAVVFAGLLGSGWAMAQTVIAVDLFGNRTVPADVIRAVIPVEVGQPLQIAPATVEQGSDGIGRRCCRQSLADLYGRYDGDLRWYLGV